MPAPANHRCFNSSDAAGSSLADHAQAKPVGENVRALLSGISVVERDRLLQAERIAVTREGYGYSPASGELWFAGACCVGALV